MKHTPTARPRTLALLLAATVLPVAPLVAQEAVVPPPAAATIPPQQAAAPVAAAPAAPVSTTPVVNSAPVFAAPSEVVQSVPVRAPVPTASGAPTTQRQATIAPAARRLRRTQPLAAPVAAARDGAPAVSDRAPSSEPIAASSAAPVASVVPASVDPLPVEAATTRTTATHPSPWLWIVGGLIASGGVIALLFTRRRRRVRNDFAEESLSVAPPRDEVPAGEPAVILPIVTRSAKPAKKPKAVNPLQEAQRPWIGISLQAVGSNARGENDLVEFNLIIENAGEVLAHDVQVSTFLINGRVKSSETEESLIEPVGKTQSRFIDLAPGTSVPIASTMSVPHGVDPCILAEAHYPLPGGGEGHIAARFVIEATNGDNVEARLDDVLERV